MLRAHRVAHAIVGREDAAVEIVFVALDQRGDVVRRRVGIRLGLAIREHARPAIPEIRRRKARRERQRRYRVVLQRRELPVDAFAWLVVGALPADRNQERQLPECFRKALPGPQQQREVTGSGPAGVGHVDVRIGAIGDQRVGMFDHVGRNIGVQVETHNEGQIVADRAAHARENFAFAVVEMLCDHGAVQIEIDGIERPSRPDAVDHDLDDTLERIPGYMCGRAGAARDGRHHLPAIGFRLCDKTRQADIDIAHGPEHFGALRHGRPTAAMHEVIIGRLRRRKGVGLVQEAADGDTGHLFLNQTLKFVIRGYA